MTRSEVYDALRAWLQSHGFDVGYRVQKRFWNELEGTEGKDTLSSSKTAVASLRKPLRATFSVSLFCQDRTTVTSTKLKTALMQYARR